VSDLPDLRDFARVETPPGEATILVRGGPDTSAKLTAHAERVRRAFLLDGLPVLGVSVFAALDDIGPSSLEGILLGKLSTYRVVHMVTAARLAEAAFGLLPTFGRPHMTLLLTGLDRIDALLELLGPAVANPRYGEMVRRRRG
jgi:hypothetical protein